MSSAGVHAEIPPHALIRVLASAFSAACSVEDLSRCRSNFIITHKFILMIILIEKKREKKSHMFSFRNSS